MDSGQWAIPCETTVPLFFTFGLVVMTFLAWVLTTDLTVRILSPCSLRTIYWVPPLGTQISASLGQWRFLRVPMGLTGNSVPLFCVLSIQYSGIRSSVTPSTSNFEIQLRDQRERATCYWLISAPEWHQYHWWNRNTIGYWFLPVCLFCYDTHNLAKLFITDSYLHYASLCIQHLHYSRARCHRPHRACKYHI